MITKKYLLPLALLLTSHAQANDQQVARIARLSELAKECSVDGAAMFQNATSPPSGDIPVIHCIGRGMETLEAADDKLRPSAKTTAALHELSKWKSATKAALMAAIPEYNETRRNYLIRQDQHQRVLTGAAAALSLELGKQK